MPCAIVLYEQDARSGQRVKACSAAAWKHAVRPGMPLAEAQTLLESGPASNSPGAVQPFFARHDARRDREALVELAEWCERFSPLVGLDQGDEPEGLLMDVSGLAQLFGGEAALAQTVVTACGQQGLTGRVAIAATVSAAWGFARWSERLADGMQHGGEKLGTGSSQDAASQGALRCQHGARPMLAQPQAEPVPLVVIPPGDAAASDRLPVDALQLSARTTAQLYRLGVQRIGQLHGLPRASLAARFGKPLLERLDKLSGAIAEPLVAHHAGEPLSVCESFEHPTTHHGAIEHVLEQLLEQLSQRLRERGQGALRLVCQLVCQNRRPLQIDVSLFRPTSAPQHLLALAKLQLAALTLPDAVEEIRIRALATAPCQQRQGQLFGDAPRDQPAPLALLIERLSNRLGREQVVRAELQADAQVELAYRYGPLAGASARPQTSCQRSPSSLGPLLPEPLAPGPLLRPLCLLQPPQPIDVVGVALDGPPAMFYYQRQRHRVARCFGPERIETGWWRGESSRRDYYRVETDSGDRWWLFRCLQDRRWFLQGLFE